MISSLGLKHPIQQMLWVCWLNSTTACFQTCLDIECTRAQMNARMYARMNSPSFICADHICDQAFACRLSFQQDAQLALRRSHFEADISVGGEAFEKHVCLHLTSGAPRPCSLERCVFSIHFSFFCVSALLFVNLKEKAAFAPKKGINPFTNEPCVFKTKPASKTVRALATKRLNVALNLAFSC